jgi:type IV secretion system protein VirB5
MKTFWKVAINLVALAFMSGTAHAGIPVVDGMSIAQQMIQEIQSVADWAQQADSMQQQISKLEQQYQQLQQQYNSLNGVRGMAQLVNNPASRNYLPMNYQSIDQNGFGNSAQLMQQNRLYDISTSNLDPTSNYVKSFQGEQNRNAANLAVLQAAYSNASNKFNDIQVLLDKLNSTPDAKDVADLQARIQAEEAMLINELIKLTALIRMQEVESEIANHQKIEMHVQSITKASN